MKHEDTNTNNSNNLVEPSNPPSPPTKVISHTSESPVVEAVKKANETITIPKADYDKLTNELYHLRNKSAVLGIKLDKIQGALIQIQATVYNTKNAI